ncbi:MAG: hypothetical protein K0S17_953 [Enterobacter mori]|uniref:glycosyltransferase n=1 Tax=Enterobacter mori TaxID=539813 RepID=UPI0020323A40|nr:glycosyltransferase [Enterobacter mori]MDF2525868.1 hypothetical protein [Enterobacter mori]
MTMKKNIDISIIIPVFNAEKTVGSLINNLLKENVLSIELIIVNDGSTDKTKEVIKAFIDPRIIYLEQSNKGVYAARNLALKHQTGEWVIFLDADDSVGKDFLSHRLHLAKKENVDVLISNAYRLNTVSDKKSSIHKKQIYDKKISGHQWINSCVANNEWPHYLWLQITRSSYIRDNCMTFHDGRSHKDILWTMTLAEKNGSFYITNNHDYTYTINSSSITNRNDYYDFRAIDYIDIISSIIKTANKTENGEIRVSLLRHSLVEARHFLGLYRKKIKDRKNIKSLFKENVDLKDIFKGICSFSDLAFFFKLLVKML